jgi:hypothetical protein
MPVLVRAGFLQGRGLGGLGAQEDVSLGVAGSEATFLLLRAASWVTAWLPNLPGLWCSVTSALVSFRLRCLVTHLFMQEGVGLLKLLKVPALQRKGGRYQACACGAPFLHLTPQDTEWVRRGALEEEEEGLPLLHADNARSRCR